ncbi:urease accessory protein UreH domain-containing protein [Cellulomonas carbonis]|uniref:HMA domain-containing protein n=1 Tax=Cellulomonas carbonis T26 TaxID=947969 RepID=A0A0A0BUB0_9CELL|nr:sulfite exporter TauE/SafE family protein [Cellulomonas carbonis]KGM11242.1 hypothetical protein N868_11495 [Cellulomonas carbonis T26]GGC10912.1 hypothetical protein GCM10010972_25340 [Cellulomonas carbonis]
MARTDIAVRGMTCRSCEVRVGRAVRAVPGVRSVDVSATTGRVRVVTDADADRRATTDAVQAAVVAAGYSLGQDSRAWVSRDARVWRDVALATVAVLGVAALARAAGVEDVSARLGALGTSGSLALVVLLGVAAGLSTCMALVGGLVLAVSSRHAQQHPEATTARRLRPHVAFNVGRVVGFGVLGALLGAVGSAVRMSGGTVALLTLVVSLAMVAVGLQLTGVSPRLARGSLALPAGLAARLGLEGRAEARYSDARAAAVGAASFLLPCGFTQTVQLYALATGSPLRAGAVMALFALGTVPGLLGIGGLTSLARGGASPRFFRVAGVVVLAFAAVNVGGAVTVLAPGLGRAGDSADVAGGAAGAVSANVTVEDGVQVLRTTQVVDGYEPQVATVLAGVPLRWEIDSTVPSCASALYAPALGTGSAPVLLQPGVTVLELPAPEEGRLDYSCAMGMYTGTVHVVEAP